jgi:general secretion pathway protein K
VLVTVLWSIVLLSSLAMAASLTFRGFAGVMAVSRDRLRADGLLTAGLEVAAGLAAGGRAPLYDVESSVTLASGTISIRLDDEGGRIDIGRAPAEVLEALFRSVGAQDAQALAQQIIEWRKPDPVAAAPPTAATPNSARPAAAGTDDENDDATDEEPAPGNAGPAAQPPAAAPKPAPTSASILTSVAQLLQVPGMRPEWVGAVAPLVTVFGNETVNPMTAPPAVLTLLPGIDRERLAAFLEARRHPIDPQLAAGMLGATQKYLAVRPAQAISVELRAMLADGYTARASAVIVRLKTDPEPYRVLAWTLLPAPLRP